MGQILIVEDEPIIRGSLKRLLERHQHHVYEAGSVQEALSQPIEDCDLIIADLRLPGEAGTALLEKTDLPVLIMTSYSSVESAVEAMKLGAVDYIAKPFNHDEMVLTIERILERRHLQQQNQHLQEELSKSYPVKGMIGQCAQMREVFERISRVAPTDTTVLILGESGTGKELVARALHDQSQRHRHPIITVNCAAIPENLLESELFGHEKGAFTGAEQAHRGLIESADGGTLFLDEIGELPLEAQARLLRVLQEGEIRRVGANQSHHVDIRLLAATHRDLKTRVQEGRFREDLYFRLHVMEIELPPLRERGDDIIALARVLLKKHCQKLNRPSLQLSEAALKALSAYAWPGNVRELENALERTVILSDGPLIEVEDLSLDAGGIPKTGASPPPESASLDDYFVHFVQSHQGSMTETELARQLGISRKTLWERRQRLGIPRQKT